MFPTTFKKNEYQTLLNEIFLMKTQTRENSSLTGTVAFKRISAAMSDVNTHTRL